MYVLQVELTKKDLQHIRHKIRRRNIVFSNKKFLDSLFLPSEIIGRKERDSAIDIIRRALREQKVARMRIILSYDEELASLNKQ